MFGLGFTDGYLLDFGASLYGEVGRDSLFGSFCKGLIDFGLIWRVLGIGTFV